MRRKGLPEYLVKGVASLYEGRKAAASIEGELSDSFSVKVGVHQGSALSPLLFVIVMDDGCFGRRRERWFIDSVVACI